MTDRDELKGHLAAAFTEEARAEIRRRAEEERRQRSEQFAEALRRRSGGREGQK